MTLSLPDDTNHTFHRCTACKHLLTSSAHFCPQCGERVRSCADASMSTPAKFEKADRHADRTPVVLVLSCPMCAGRVDATRRECAYCNAPLLFHSAVPYSDTSVQSDVLSTAVAAWQAKIRSDPDNAEYHYSLGLLHLQRRLREAAIHEFRLACQQCPDNHLAHYHLGVALFANGNIRVASQDFQDAVQAFETSLTICHDFKPAQGFKHGLMALRLLDTDVAQSVIKGTLAVEANPEAPILHNNLGYGLFQQGQLEKAEVSFVKATEMEPHLQLAWSNLCLARMRRRNPHQAIIAGKRAVA
ncbi:tetratricopeptide repeat protein [Planctomicrobium sp. SH664]|uniref:tetratricopeptide repeat protein n=1 Tax=Planctomicrobium sp. SH664 TaxID=3448125 RepID=UPI003F5C09F0